MQVKDSPPGSSNSCKRDAIGAAVVALLGSIILGTIIRKPGIEKEKARWLSASYGFNAMSSLMKSKTRDDRLSYRTAIVFQIATALVYALKAMGRLKGSTAL